MQSKYLILAAAAALLLMRKPAAAAASTGAATAPRAPIGTAGNMTTSGPQRQYFDPVGVAAQFANRVLSSWGDVSRQNLPAATANPEGARNAVRAGDSYYGLGAIAWGAGNIEAARDAVRAGDTYYTSRDDLIADAWAVDANLGTGDY